MKCFMLFLLLLLTTTVWLIIETGWTNSSRRCCKLTKGTRLFVVGLNPKTTRVNCKKSVWWVVTPTQ